MDANAGLTAHIHVSKCLALLLGPAHVRAASVLNNVWHLFVCMYGISVIVLSCGIFAVALFQHYLQVPCHYHYSILHSYWLTVKLISSRAQNEVIACSGGHSCPGRTLYCFAPWELAHPARKPLNHPSERCQQVYVSACVTRMSTSVVVDMTDTSVLPESTLDKCPSHGHPQPLARLTLNPTYKLVMISSAIGYLFIMKTYTRYSKNKSKCKLQLIHTHAQNRSPTLKMLSQ